MRAAALPTPVEIDLEKLDVSSRRHAEQTLDRLPRPGAADATEAISTTRPVASVGTERLEALDAARVLATFGIIWTHVAEAQGLPIAAGTLGRFGTSFYILAAALFIARSGRRPVQRPFWEDTKKRAQRLLLPFLTWSLIYGAYYGYRGLSAGASVQALTFWWGPFAGTAIHLWFLPFIFVWGAVGAACAPRLWRLPRPILFVAGAGICSLIYFVSYDYVFFAVNRYWLWDYHLHRLDRWIVEVPLFITALWGSIAFLRLPDGMRRVLSKHLVALAVGGAAVFFVTQYLYSQNIEFIREETHTEGRFMANLAGLGLMAWILSLSRSRAIVRLAPLGRYTYLAFLSHMLVLELLRSPLAQLPHHGSIPTAIASCIIVMGASLLFSHVIARTRWLSWLRP